MGRGREPPPLNQNQSIMKANYLFRLVLANGNRKMIASHVKTQTDARCQALELMEELKAINVEIWHADDLTPVMEIRSK